MAYTLSLITTVAVMLLFDAAQPALLYIVPFVMVTSFGCALVRGEVRKLWAWECVPEDPADKEKEEKANKKDKKDKKAPKAD